MWFSSHRKASIACGLSNFVLSQPTLIKLCRSSWPKMEDPLSNLFTFVFVEDVMLVKRITSRSIKTSWICCSKNILSSAYVWESLAIKLCLVCEMACRQNLLLMTKRNYNVQSICFVSSLFDCFWSGQWQTKVILHVCAIMLHLTKCSKFHIRRKRNDQNVHVHFPVRSLGCRP